MGKFVIVDHPLVEDKITKLRCVNTGKKDFRELVEEITALICYEATRDLKLDDVEVETPICKTSGKKLGVKVGVISILRAGIGMENGMLSLMPTARVGHVGLYRDPETLLPVEYYCKIPEDCATREIFLVDPMLATGGTACAAIDYLKRAGVTNIRLISIISCPEGVKKVRQEYPEVDIYTAAYDSHLNEHGYIVPGLGDAGDRLFGTK